MNLSHLTITTRRIIPNSLMALMLISIGAMGLFGMRPSSAAIQAIHDEANLPAPRADESIDKLLLNRTQVLPACQHAPDSPLASLHDPSVSAHPALRNMLELAKRLPARWARHGPEGGP